MKAAFFRNTKIVVNIQSVAPIHRFFVGKIEGIRTKCFFIQPVLFKSNNVFKARGINRSIKPLDKFFRQKRKSTAMKKHTPPVVCRGEMRV